VLGGKTIEPDLKKAAAVPKKWAAAAPRKEKAQERGTWVSHNLARRGWIEDPRIALIITVPTKAAIPAEVFPCCVSKPRALADNGITSPQ
jgi:hypothetical protein